MKFIKDINGRIPFAVLGVMLIFGSIVTSTIITSLEKEYAKGISYILPSEREKYILWYVEADLARALDKAARKALKDIGKTPVVDASECKVEEFKKADNIKPALNTQNGKELATAVNINRARYHALRALKNYILLNFYDDSFQMHGYIINVKKIVNNDIENVNPSKDFSYLEVEIINMNIEQRPSHPLGGNRNNYRTYLKMGLPVEIEIKNASTGKTVFVEKRNINTLIMNRFLLLEDMTKDFEDNLQTFSNLGVEALASIMLLTWTRGYLQWATSFGGKAMPANIISNQWVAIATTSAILLEEGFVFNAVDPLGPLYVGYETADAIFCDITGEHLDDIVKMFQAGADLVDYVITDLKDINKIANDMIERLKNGGEGLPCSQESIQQFQDLISDKNWEQVSQEFSIEDLAEDELTKIINKIDSRIKDVYKADVFIETIRNKINGNRDKIDEEIRELQEVYERNAEIDMKDEAETKAIEDTSLTDASIISSLVISTSTVNEEIDEKEWELIKDDTYMMEDEGYFDNSNPDRVVLGGEKWHVNRTREVIYSWETEAKWKITLSNATDTDTVEVTTTQSHSETKTEWSEENVVVKFVSDLYVNGNENIGENDIVDPFSHRDNIVIYQGGEGGGDAVLDDPNLGEMENAVSILDLYKRGEYINWPTNNPFSQTQIEIFEGNVANDYRMTVITGIEDGKRCFPEDLLNVAVQTLKNLKNTIVNEVVIKQEFKADDPVTDPGAFLSETIGELKKKFDDKKEEFIAQSHYMENGKYKSAAAKVIYLLRKDYVESIGEKLENEKNNAKEEIETSYQHASKEHREDRSYDDNVNDAEKAKQMQNQKISTTPGTMILDGEWSEKVCLSVYQLPHFLGVDYYNELKERLSEEKESEEGDKLLGAVETPELLRGITLTYSNTNIFSPLAGIDNLIDMGFDALNKQVFDAIDKGFAQLEEVLTDLEELNTITYVDENGNEVTEEYNVFTEEDRQKIEEKMDNAAQLIVEGKNSDGFINEFKNKIYNRVNTWSNRWLYGGEILTQEEIEEAIKNALGNGEYKDQFRNIKNEEEFEQKVLGELLKKLDEKKKNSNNKLKGIIVDTTKEILQNEIREMYRKAVSNAINNVKDELKTAFKELSEELSDKLKDKVKNILEEELMEKIGDKIAQQIQSTCGGIIPAGLPVLPPFGWWCTINAWVVHVEGYIPYFEVVDTMHFPEENPIFGHEAQSYVRKNDQIREDVTGDGFSDVLGLNTPIHFYYTTGSFIIVPPGGTGVGDRVGGFIEEEKFEG